MAARPHLPLHGQPGIICPLHVVAAALAQASTSPALPVALLGLLLQQPKRPFKIFRWRGLAGQQLTAAPWKTFPGPRAPRTPAPGTPPHHTASGPPAGAPPPEESQGPLHPLTSLHSQPLAHSRCPVTLSAWTSSLPRSLLDEAAGCAQGRVRPSNTPTRHSPPSNNDTQTTPRHDDLPMSWLGTASSSKSWPFYGPRKTSAGTC